MSLFVYGPINITPTNCVQELSICLIENCPLNLLTATGQFISTRAEEWLVHKCAFWLFLNTNRRSIPMHKFVVDRRVVQKEFVVIN